MTAPAPPKATQSQGELKRALVECLAKAMFAVSHEEPWEQAEELTRRIYLEEAPAGVDAVCLKLATGSPEVIEAMARADCSIGCSCNGPQECHSWPAFANGVRAALAAGMKVVAND